MEFSLALFIIPVTYHGFDVKFRGGKACHLSNDVIKMIIRPVERLFSICSKQMDVKSSHRCARLTSIRFLLRNSAYLICYVFMSSLLIYASP